MPSDDAHSAEQTSHKVLRFDSSCKDADASEDGPRQSAPPRRRSRPRKSLPVPSTAYGFCVPYHVSRRIVASYIGDDSDSELEKEESNAVLVCGARFANSFCQDTFPDLPLRWRQAIYVRTAKGDSPIIMLGRRTAKSGEEIFFNDEQIQQLKDLLELGDDQQPGWYKVLYSSDDK
ncbi:hypothetical protein HGRIS_012378 [Hohenbuehelia grisea]|uniref:Uncharacterized protein n=1 Tax=Hohenbuehelia grisea TaxID=104357 RepID=A0ABR3IS37_9AGAR